MNYTLHQLQVFLKVAKTRSITRAAEEMHLTQPAVSIQLKNLQNQFEIPLTEVIGRQLYITDFGQEIAEMAERILNEVYAINYKTLAHKGQLTGRLRISSVSTGKYIIPYFLSPFMHLNPGIELALDVTNRSTVVEDLRNNKVDFAVMSILPDQPELEVIPLLPNHLHLIGSKEAIAKRTNFELTELPLVFREHGSGTRHLMEKYFLERNVIVRKNIELKSNEAVKQAVLSGLGFSILPIIGLKNELSLEELQVIPMKGFPLISSWQLVWLKKKKHSPAAEAFKKFVLKSKEDIVSTKFAWSTKY
jgi:DNA-binding transcriptional LysR family regulator